MYNFNNYTTKLKVGKVKQLVFSFIDNNLQFWYNFYGVDVMKKKIMYLSMVHFVEIGFHYCD